jgi:hypothetical protein
MSALRRLSLPLLLVAAVAWSALGPPVRAQQALATRYSFADTTLLRDTLDLSFVGLFELADSLRVVPDTLRALSIRYRLPIDYLAYLATDSLRVPVDSVGPILERERFNPLSIRAERVTSFRYSTVYTINRQSTSWSNSSDYQLVRGPIVLRNVTTVRIDRIREGGQLSFHRAKSAGTEAGWKFSPDLSVGTRVNLTRNENFRPGSIYNRTTTTNEFQFSLRSRHEPARNLQTELNAFGGPFDEPNSLPVKRGFGTRVDGRLAYVTGRWMTFDLSGFGNARVGRSRLPRRTWHPIRDISGDASGSIGLWSSSPVSVLIGYRARHDRIQRPDTIGTLQESGYSVADLLNNEPSGSYGADVAVQVRHGGFGATTVTTRANRTTSVIAVARNGRFVNDRSLGNDAGFDVDGRYQWAGWSFDMRLSGARPYSESPRRTVLEVPASEAGPARTVTVDYRERSRTETRSIVANLGRSLTPQLFLRANGQVSLSSYRFGITDSAYVAQTGTQRVEPSDPREDYRQSYRVDATYTGRRGLSNTVGLEVQRTLSLFLNGARSVSNREDRVYRADWRWTYRLLEGLTATQRNQINATYTNQYHQPQRNRLGLSYLSITTLNAVLTPRLQVDLTHNANYRPNGEYLRAADGLEYFSLSDANRDYTLTGRIAYSPVGGITISLEPYYQATGREATSDGLASPDNERRTLNFSGGASLNFPVGGRGQLSGTLTRSQQSNRYTKYVSGVARTEPRVETDFWNGSLQFSWNL